MGLPPSPWWFKNRAALARQRSRSGGESWPSLWQSLPVNQRDILWKMLVARAPFFADNQRKVERRIPLAILMPKT
jgi:hypothetical protein